jgi:aryl-alcohol dehydrogenase-like predicted oxidoreductase
MATLVRAGKVRYWGISNAPAWYIAKLATLAAAHALPSPIALQFEYSLVERGVEHEHLPAAAEFGLGMQPWSPLAGGFLSDKYRREDPANVAGKRSPALPDGTPDTGGGEHRLSGANPFGDTKFTDRDWDILQVLREVAGDIGVNPAEVALAWLMGRQDVDSVLIGASRPEQVMSNIAARDVTLPPPRRQHLDDASALQATYPSGLFTPVVKRFIFGGYEVAPWR